MNYYSGESFVITTTLNVDITGATCLIKWIDPAGDTGSKAGTITDASNGVYEVKIENAEFTTLGRWRVWSYVTLSSGDISIGNPRDVYIFQEGQKT